MRGLWDLVVVCYNGCYNGIVGVVKVTYSFITEVILNSEASEALKILNEASEVSEKLVENAENLRSDIVNLENDRNFVCNRLEFEQNQLINLKGEVDSLENTILKDNNLLKEIKVNRGLLIEKAVHIQNQTRIFNATVNKTLGIDHTNCNLFDPLIWGEGFNEGFVDPEDAIDSVENKKIAYEDYLDYMEDTFPARGQHHGGYSLTEIFDKRPVGTDINEHIAHRNRVHYFIKTNPEFVRVYKNDKMWIQWMKLESKKDKDIFKLMYTAKINLVQSTLESDKLISEIPKIDETIIKTEHKVRVDSIHFGKMKNCIEEHTKKCDNLAQCLKSADESVISCKQNLLKNNESFLDCEAVKKLHRVIYAESSPRKLGTRFIRWYIKSGVKDILTEIFSRPRPPGDEPPWGPVSPPTPIPVVTVIIVGDEFKALVGKNLINIVIFFSILVLSSILIWYFFGVFCVNFFNLSFVYNFNCY